MKKVLVVFSLLVVASLPFSSRADLTPVPVSVPQACEMAETAVTCMALGTPNGFSFKCENVVCRRFDFSANPDSTYYRYQCTMQYLYPLPDSTQVPFPLSNRTAELLTETMLQNASCTQSIRNRGLETVVQCPLLFVVANWDRNTNECISGSSKVGK